MSAPAGLRLRWEQQAAKREVDLAEINFMRANGESWASIARALGITHRSLSRNLDRWRARGLTTLICPDPKRRTRNAA